MHSNFTPFWSKIWDHFFPFLFPKDYKNLKSLDIGAWEFGAKRPLIEWKSVRDKQTNRQTGILTYRKNWPRGLILWKIFVLTQTPLKSVNKKNSLAFLLIALPALRSFKQKKCNNIFFIWKSKIILLTLTTPNFKTKIKHITYTTKDANFFLMPFCLLLEPYSFQLTKIKHITLPILNYYQFYLLIEFSNDYGTLIYLCCYLIQNVQQLFDHKGF